jgi:hypothetical protein
MKVTKRQIPNGFAPTDVVLSADLLRSAHAWLERAAS